MWQLFLLVVFSIHAGISLAEEVAAVPHPPMNSEKAIQSGNPGTADDNALPTIVIPENSVSRTDCPPSQPLPETESDKLHRQQSQIATKKIEVFRRTVKDTTRSGGFLSSLFSSSRQPIDIELLADMDRFIMQYPNLSETAEVYELKSQVHSRMETYYAAAVDSLMLMAGYPDSAFAVEASKRLDELSIKQLKKQAATIGVLTQKAKSLKGDHDHRIAAYLADIASTLNEADFAVPVAAECALFLQSNQSYLDEDIIEHALARQSILVDNQIAAYHFNKLLALYPSSPMRPDSLLSLGEVQRKGLKSYDQAAQSYSKLIEQYPESQETKLGYQSLAAMYELDMKDYPNALKTHAAIVSRYKDDPAVLQSLRSMAQIYQNKTGQPAKAIETYIKISEIFKGSDALDALDKAEGIATSSRDWKVAMNINDRIIALAPKTDSAAKAAFANAEIAESNLNDREQARKLYTVVVDSYPDHSLAKEAHKRINAIDDKKQN